MDFETVLEFKEINILQCIHNYFKNKYFGLKMQFSSLVSTTKKKRKEKQTKKSKKYSIKFCISAVKSWTCHAEGL